MTAEQEKALRKDFRDWGITPVRRIRKMGRKYGVLMSARIFSNKKQG